MSKRASVQAEDLRWVMQRLFRRFGALSSASTPCGKPLSMAHAHALMVLLGSGERSQQALGEELCIDKSNVARLCAKMVTAGHVRQRTADNDGRSRLVDLTPKGERLAKDVEVASRERFGAWLRGVPRARRADVVRAVQQLVDALDAPELLVATERSCA